MTNPKKEYFQVANANTGEVMGYTLPSDFNNENYEIRNRKQIKKIKNIMDKRNNPFTFAHMDNIKKLLEGNEIKLSTLGGLLLLSCYINSEDTLISKRNEKFHPPYSRQEIQEILSMKDRTFVSFLKEATDSGILVVEGTQKNKNIDLLKNIILLEL